MNRRGFLSAIGGAVAAASFDPERALWVPGVKTISIPKPLDARGLQGLYEDAADEIWKAFHRELSALFQVPEHMLFGRSQARCVS